MARASITVDVHTSPWVRAMLFATADLLAAVEGADEVLVTDEILEAARALRAVIDGDVRPEA